MSERARTKLGGSRGDATVTLGPLRVKLTGSLLVKYSRPDTREDMAADNANERSQHIVVLEDKGWARFPTRRK